MTLILLILALVCFLVGTVAPFPSPVWKINWVSLGLAFWVASAIFGSAGRLGVH